MRILGIDIGSTSIRAVEMDSAFSRFDIHDYHEHAIDSGQTPEQTIQKLINGLPKPPDRIIVALPQKYSTFRNLQLPTRDKKAIQSGIRFELEDELPFSPDHCFFDYTILLQSKLGSQVHVAASLKEHVRATVDYWKGAGIEPDIITSKAWAFRSLFNRILATPEKNDVPALFLGIGRDTTTLYVHHKGIPVITREIRFGGQDLTLAIAKKMNISEVQAETLKRDQGYVSTPDGETNITPEQKEVSACIEAALTPLLIELKRIEIACKSATQQGIHTIYLGGGGALLPGLPKWVEQQLEIPSQLLHSLSSITTSGVTYSEQTDSRFSLALALSLCLVGSDRGTCINFRKSEFSKVSTRSRQLNFDALKKPLLGVGIVTGCLFFSLLIQSAVYKSRLTTTDAQLEKSVRSFFGQLSNSAMKTYLSNPSTLKSSLQKELNKQRELSRLFGPNPRSPLDFLKSISQTIPKDIVLDLTQFQTGMPPAESYTGKEKHTASLTFLVSNPQMADKLASVLSNKFEDFQKGKMEEVPATADSGKKWKITFSGKPTEETYGK